MLIAASITSQGLGHFRLWNDTHSNIPGLLLETGQNGILWQSSDVIFVV